jgi:NCS1 family nucleobase:cation symporter-1
MTLFAFIGVAVTSASAIIFGEAIWNPVQLLSRLDSPAVILVSLFALTVATLSTNVAANVVAPAYGFASLMPEKITFARGAILTGILGVAFMPWRLLADYGTYIFVWLGGYAGFLGPIAGIFIADYWVVRRGRLDLADLYDPAGRYGRWNPAALWALGAGVALALVGRFVEPLRVLYGYSWFVGFGTAFALYCVLMRGTPQVELEGVPPVEPSAPGAAPG